MRGFGLILAEELLSGVEKSTGIRGSTSIESTVGLELSACSVTGGEVLMSLQSRTHV